MASAASGAHAGRSADSAGGAYSQKHYLDGVRPKGAEEPDGDGSWWESYLPKFLPLVHPSPLNFRWQAKKSVVRAGGCPGFAEACG